MSETSSERRHWKCRAFGHKYTTRMRHAGETFLWTTCRRCGFDPKGDLR